MKKTVLLFTGIIFMAAAAIPFSSASRNAYHAYVTAEANLKQQRQYAANAEQNFEVFQYNQNLYRASRQRDSRRFSSTPSAIRVSDTNTTYVENLGQISVDQGNRRFAIRNGAAPWQKTLRRSVYQARVIAQNVPKSMQGLRTFENDAFSVSLPVGAQAKADDVHAFTVFHGQMNLRIKRFDAETCDKTFGFRGCANNITRAENNALVEGKGRLISSGQAVRQTYKSDTVLGQVNVQTNVFTEKFTAQSIDGLEYTFYRYAAQDVDGGVYYIEIQVPAEFAAQYVAISDAIFDSFRIYATN